ncbi:MAG: 4Fe-4S dicluster domain-containing protein [Phycisphaerae bacterium]|nr:4Fe-4S dicluster domain-containing protein [Phycisphaerae bacterium]
MTAITTERIAACGVVGAGGAGFPTSVKLGGKAEVAILNAAECEPLLHKDKELLRAYGADVLAGLATAMRLTGATRGIVGIKGKYTDVIEQLTPQLPAGIEIKTLGDSYPTGDEFILVYDCIGRIIPPGGLPRDVGAVVVNVETAMNVARGEPVTKKFLTVAGAVAEPVTIGVPVGVTFAECLALTGGATTDRPVALVGGAMMGKLARSLDDTVTKTTGGLIILDESHPLIRRYRNDWPVIRRIGAAACDQCSFCTELCPRYLLGHPIEPHKAMRSLGFSLAGEANVIGTLYCCECNLCTMYSCPEDLDPKNVCSQNKQRLMKDRPKVKFETNPNRANLHLDNRRAPIKRLIAKLGLAGFRNVGPLIAETVAPRRVVLPTKQHVGAPAEPVVKVGDHVNVGDVVARPAEGALGAVIHASIAGRVRAVDGSIVIEA